MDIIISNSNNKSSSSNCNINSNTSCNSYINNSIITNNTTCFPKNRMYFTSLKYKNSSKELFKNDYNENKNEKEKEKEENKIKSAIRVHNENINENSYENSYENQYGNNNNNNNNIEYKRFYSSRPSVNEKSLNKITLIGRVGCEPDIKILNGGDKVATFSLATNEYWRDKNTNELKSKTDWHRVVVYDQGIVELVHKYLKKGRRIYIQGSLQYRRWFSNDVNNSQKQISEIVLSYNKSDLIFLDDRRNFMNRGETTNNNNNNNNNNISIGNAGVGFGTTRVGNTRVGTSRINSSRIGGNSGTTEEFNGIENNISHMSDRRVGRRSGIGAGIGAGTGEDVENEEKEEEEEHTRTGMGTRGMNRNNMMMINESNEINNMSSTRNSHSNTHSNANYINEIKKEGTKTGIEEDQEHDQEQEPEQEHIHNPMTIIMDEDEDEDEDDFSGNFNDNDDDDDSTTDSIDLSDTDIESSKGIYDKMSPHDFEE